MKAIIADPSHTGHHLQFVGVLARGLLDLGVEVTLLLGRNAHGSAEANAHLCDVVDRVQSLAVLQPPADASMSRWRDAVRDFMTHLAPKPADRVFVPYADGMAQILGLPWTASAPLRHAKAEGLLMRGNWAYPHTHWKRRARAELSRRLVLRGPWDVLHLLDPLPYLAMRHHPAVRSGRVRLIPEAVEPLTSTPPNQARRQLGLPEDGQWMVVTGLQDRRKGSDRLVRAFLAARKPHDARLLLAGRLSDELKQQLADDAGDAIRGRQLFVIDRYLSEEDHALALNAADFMASPHPDAVGSSGLLVRAAALRKPVLASDYGWVGWATNTFALGRTVNVTQPQSYARAISDFFEAPPTFGNALTDRFLHFHQLDNHLAHWLAETRNDLHQPVSPALCRWDDLYHPDEISLPPRANR